MALEDPEEGASITADGAVETARAQAQKTAKLVEECKAQRAERNSAFGRAKEAASQQRLVALRDVVKEFGPADATALPIVPPTPAGRYEPLQETYVDLVIRIGRFDKVGIIVKSDGVIETAPGGLFNSDYTIIGIDGKRFKPGLENTDGAHTIILRCKNAEMLASLSRVPEKLLKGRALKLMQLKIQPGDKGFGIDLSEVNHVAGVVKGGKAEAADLRVGDVIVAADGVGIGSKKLVDVLRKGRPSYVFNVVRPAALSHLDRADELLGDDEEDAPTKPAAANGDSNGVAEPSGPEDELKRKLAESLGNMQAGTEMLIGPAVRITRTTPKDGNAMTVEWALRPGSPAASHYHLQWKLVYDAEWTQTAASQKIGATVVTKGNLSADGLYQFRVRACAKDSGEWGAWCTPSTPLAPYQPPAESDNLSTITEENSEATFTSAAKSTAAKSAAAKPASPTPKAETGEPETADANVPGAAKEVVQGLLKDQRQAFEEEKSSLKAELQATKEELEDWKGKFLEAASNSMQEVVEAKATTRAEVLAELEAESKAVAEMKEEASKSVELIRAAEKVAEEAREESAHYKKRFDDAKAEAKAETDKEADAKIQVVMRNAALEMKGKLQFVEQQTDATVRRAVEKALGEAKAESEKARRDERVEMEANHERALQAMRDMVGQGAKHRIGEIQAAQDERIQAAVRAALAEAREEWMHSEEKKIALATADAIEATETRMQSTIAAMNQQLQTVKKEAEEKMSYMHTDQDVKAMLTKKEEEAERLKEKAVREIEERIDQKVEMERQKALESVNEKIRTSVRERELELLADNRKELQNLAEAELKEASKVVKASGMKASQQLGSGNEQFEEELLMKTRPPLAAAVSLDDMPTKGGRPKLTAAGLEESDLVEHPLPSRTAPAMRKLGSEDDNESMVAPPLDYLRMKARHKAEENAMLARQSADQYREEEEGSEAGQLREGRERRAAEKAELKKRQLKEAMEAGRDLAYVDQAQKALDDTLDPEEALFMGKTGEDEIRQRTSAHPELGRALAKVSDLEKRLQSLQAKEGAAGSIPGLDRGDHTIARENVQSILQKGSERGITDAERESLQEVMDLLQRHIKRDKTMKQMLRDIEPSADDAAYETASCVGQDIAREEDQMGALASQLQELMTRNTGKVKLSEDEASLLRQLTSELKSQQEQAEMREAQIAWLQAESKRSRLTAVLDARSELEKLHADAIAQDQLDLPIGPIAAAEDAFSIAVDWMPPTSDAAARYHLQWRSEEDSTWMSSAASEKISVPCCTKGHLKTNLAYRFRVRAADKDGRWGQWSAPTEPTTPTVLLANLPSRPQLKPLSKCRVEARWSPPEGKAQPVGYELQWKRCDKEWGKQSLECDEVIAASPSLAPGEYYTFRVRASVKRYSGLTWTDWSPPSAPILIKDGSKPSKGGKDKKGKKEAAPPPSMPKRTDDEATESVIEADLRGAMSGYHPTAQAAVEAKLAQVKKQRQQDDANLKTLEERNRAIAHKTREDQLNELVRMKREMLNRSLEDGDDVGMAPHQAPFRGDLEGNGGGSVVTGGARAAASSWD